MRWWPCRSGAWRQEDGSSDAFGMSMNIAQIQAMAADLGARTLGQVNHLQPLQPWVHCQGLGYMIHEHLPQSWQWQHILAPRSWDR